MLFYFFTQIITKLSHKLLIINDIAIQMQFFFSPTQNEDSDDPRGNIQSIRKGIHSLPHYRGYAHTNRAGSLLALRGIRAAAGLSASYDIVKADRGAAPGLQFPAVHARFGDRRHTRQRSRWFAHAFVPRSAPHHRGFSRGA